MSKMLSEIASLVRINLNRVNDSTTVYTQLITDIKTVINSRYEQLWNKRLWPETMVFDQAMTLTANEKEFDLPSGVSLITRIRIGDSVLLPQDASKDTSYQYHYINLGREGIRLMDSFSSDQSALVDGKGEFSKLYDGSTPCIPVEDVLVNIVTADFLKLDETDHARAIDFVNEANAQYNQLVERYESQMANQKRVIPAMPFTDLSEFQMNVSTNTSPVFW